MGQVCNAALRHKTHNTVPSPCYRRSSKLRRTENISLGGVLTSMLIGHNTKKDHPFQIVLLRSRSGTRTRVSTVSQRIDTAVCSPLCSSAITQKKDHPFQIVLPSSRSGTRTRVSTVRGWRANRYTNRPLFPTGCSRFPSAKLIPFSEPTKFSEHFFQNNFPPYLYITVYQHRSPEKQDSTF